MVSSSLRMEFTPKKSALSTVNANALRHNPYASGGSKFIRKFKNHRSNVHVTPPRSGSDIQRRFNTRVDRILSSAKTTLTSEVKTTPVKLKSPQPTKRPFVAVNGKLDNNDPYNVFTDSDDDHQPTPRKEPRTLVTNDKENHYQSSDEELLSSRKEQKNSVWLQKKSPLGNSKPKSVKVYSNKRKPLRTVKSRLVNDVSPELVEKAYGPKSLFSAEKENVPVRKSADSTTSQVPLPHLIGFPNYGNTCYLNSVLQSLLGLPTFLCDYRQIASELGLNSTSLFYGLSQVLYSRMKGQATGLKLSLRTVKENLERIDGSFSGFKMQDANEFLTKILDVIKDEIDRCYASQSPVSKTTKIESHDKLACSSAEDTDDEIFLSGARSVNDDACDLIMEVTTGDSGIQDCDNVNYDSDPGSELVMGKSQRNQKSLSAKMHDIIHAETNPAQVWKNPVKDNFEFQLLESYRCLGCGEVEGRKQSYFGLYVNLPDGGGHTLQDAVSSYMGEDERELTCEKCGHGTSSVVTTITSVPRILIIQLKRYKYKPEQCESIKMSSKVLVNRWITLDDFIVESVAGPSHWNPETKSTSQLVENPKQATLTVRNLSSELNICSSKEKEDDGILPSISPVKIADNSTAATVDEDEELQMVMRRSMEDVQGEQEEDEIQQAIRLSLQDMGMSYNQENQEESLDKEDNKKEEIIAVAENQESRRHAYCLISIISHFGLTTNTGHYVSDVYNCEEESWFHYDDESVAKIAESVVFAEGRQKNGYIFFYMHKDLMQKVKNKNKR
ncbi:ubiquitin carboxyl-terminal hydrolase 37-like [Palaemon carinicauda]|uniref:ubiquitin carboxyl-terminal hydrolase 37-like n=1 Tax=Palaemon carinicauda TaxID=392227 RepID=UPI0035B67C51